MTIPKEPNRLNPLSMFIAVCWVIGILGVIAFIYAMTSTGKLVSYLLLFSPCAGFALFVGGTTSLINGFVQLKRDREKTTSDKEPIKSLRMMIFGCFGLLISVCIISAIGYIFYLSSIRHY